jgi:hypothetical protein
VKDENLARLGWSLGVGEHCSDWAGCYQSATKVSTFVDSPPAQLSSNRGTRWFATTAHWSIAVHST